MSDKPRKNKKLPIGRILMITGVLILSCCGVFGIGSLFSNDDNSANTANTTDNQDSNAVAEDNSSDQSEEDVASDPSPIPQPTPTPMPAPTEIPGLLEAGTYLVGTDIMPGIYWGKAGEGLFGSCYWERVSDLSGSFEAIIANDNGEGSFYLEILDTDFAVEVGCQIAPVENAPVVDYQNVFPTGTYIVGRDIFPGIYWGRAGEDITDSCYWARLENVTGSFDALLANDNAEGSFYFEVLDGDFAIETGCEIMHIDLAPNLELGDVIPVGTYIVGRDIQPGLYKGQAGDDIINSCYWERLRNVSGSFNSILANDNSTGSYYVEVLETDFALKTKCELQKVSE